MSSEIVRLPLPSGDEVTVNLVINSDGSFIVKPVSGNINNIHHHYYKDSQTGESTWLVRDREGYNEKAYVFRNGGWRERTLTSQEKRYLQ
ncbi:hypothetical protein [Nodularia sphaerocarpa]|uniref:hypothetical protein n=1 Tax=Nodularia sphaerocarpa TaxID=137816 RepID=UPI00232F1309|nr:hypothetical protein [Nodularia sphaerocarpa]MDB9373264.1 hypothetical protein [Nodularia sphaerocarpa CS-585]MDB9378426.1 hypothetical protein [Nodularia sphaerocarpa CS-585A2]